MISYLIFSTLIFTILVVCGMSAYGIPVNQELHLQQSFCHLKGSHISSDPNPDDKFREMQNIVNEYIYGDQAGIYFESSVSLPISDRTSSPRLDDTDIRPVGGEQEGDIYRDAFGTEGVRTKNNCVEVWSKNSDGDPIPINGIITLVVNLIVDGGGNIYKTDGSQVIGESMCKKTGSECRIPYEGYVIMIDPYYTFNGIGDLYQDIIYQYMAHELGHPLSAGDLLSPTNNLMYWKQQHNSSGIVDNIGIHSTQKDDFWLNGKKIPGSYIVSTVPVSKVISVNPWLRFAIVDHLFESNQNPRSDISSIDIYVNTNSSSLVFDINFDSLLSQNSTQNLGHDYWLLFNRDNNVFTKNFTKLINSTFGASNLTDLLDTKGKEAIHVKSISVDKGNYTKLVGTVWNTNDTNSSISLVPANLSQISLSHLYLNSHPSSANTSLPNFMEYPISSSITITLNNSSFVDPFVPFSVQAMSLENGKIIDVINPRMINITEHLPSNVIEQFNEGPSNTTSN